MDNPFCGDEGAILVVSPRRDRRITSPNLHNALPILLRRERLVSDILGSGDGKHQERAGAWRICSSRLTPTTGDSSPSVLQGIHSQG
jgi:hypothetical protein